MRSSPPGHRISWLLASSRGTKRPSPPGIGKKIAQRIILELKDKLAKEQGSFDTRAGALSPVSTGGKTQEAASALAVLGYSSQEISAALKGVDTALPVEEIIRIALKKMVR